MIVDYEKRITALENHNFTLIEKDIKSIQTGISSLKKQFNDYKTSMNNKIDNIDTTIGGMNRMIDDMNNKIDDLYDFVYSLNNNITDIEDNLCERVYPCVDERCRPKIWRKDCDLSKPQWENHTISSEDITLTGPILAHPYDDGFFWIVGKDSSNGVYIYGYDGQKPDPVHKDPIFSYEDGDSFILFGTYKADVHEIFFSHKNGGKCEIFLLDGDNKSKLNLRPIDLKSDRICIFIIGSYQQVYIGTEDSFNIYIYSGDPKVIDIKYLSHWGTDYTLKNGIVADSEAFFFGTSNEVTSFFSFTEDRLVYSFDIDPKIIDTLDAHNIDSKLHFYVFGDKKKLFYYNSTFFELSDFPCEKCKKGIHCQIFHNSTTTFLSLIVKNEGDTFDQYFCNVEKFSECKPYKPTFWKDSTQVSPEWTNSKTNKLISFDRDEKLIRRFC